MIPIENLLQFAVNFQYNLSSLLLDADDLGTYVKGTARPTAIWIF